MKEFVIVTYPDDRKVSLDKIPLSKNTNQVIRVETGTHTFDLGKPLDYSPPAHIVPVIGTTKEDPKIVAFVPKVTPRAGRKKVRKSAAKKAGRKKSARKKPA